MPKFRFFVSRDEFSGIAQISLKLANANHNWKIWILKIFFFWKIVESTPLACWHAFGTLERRPRWHAWHAWARDLANSDERILFHKPLILE